MSEKKMRMALNRLLSAGAALSNAAYNLSQRRSATDDDFRSLGRASKEWDAAAAGFDVGRAVASEGDTGGSAFPQQSIGSDGLPEREATPGMTLRDWFAGQALVAIQFGFSAQGYPTERIAKDCYSFADALLKARQS